jgi:hypothetical protein
MPRGTRAPRREYADRHPAPGRTDRDARQRTTEQPVEPEHRPAPSMTPEPVAPPWRRQPRAFPAVVPTPPTTDSQSPSVSSSATSTGVRRAFARAVRVGRDTNLTSPVDSGARAGTATCARRGTCVDSRKALAADSPAGPTALEPTSSRTRASGCGGLMPNGVCTPRQYKPLRTRMSSLRTARSVRRCCAADADEPGKSVKRQNWFELRRTRTVDRHCCVCSCLTVRRLSLAVLVVMASPHSGTNCCSNSLQVTALSLLSPPAAGRRPYRGSGCVNCRFPIGSKPFRARC